MNLYLALVLVVIPTIFADNADKITSLPNYKGAMTSQYSGYLTINPTTQKSLHYWFVESAVEPSSAPLILWLNGGPGCSSMDGYFYENGPFHFGPGNGNLTLQYNPWTWTRIANMIFLEAPAGVGFSYSNNQNDYKTNDNQTAADNLAALKVWFNRFPQFKSNPFWIAGESYAGIYVPTLASLVMNDKSINFKGVMVGNGVSDQTYDGLKYSFLPFVHNHGIISDETYDLAIQYCTGPSPNTQKCDQIMNVINQNMEDIDIYDIYSDCYHQRPNAYLSNYPSMQNLFKSKSPNVGLVPPCTDAFSLTKYLNLPEVQTAIHVKKGITWSICSEYINNNYVSTVTSTLPIYRNLMKANYKILIFSGDTDAAVPYTGTYAWVKSLGLSAKRSWAPWYIHKTDGKQTAGYVTEYNGLTYATVIGSGHMVPQFRPEAAYYMFSRFIHGQPL